MAKPRGQDLRGEGGGIHAVRLSGRPRGLTSNLGGVSPGFEPLARRAFSYSAATVEK